MQISIDRNQNNRINIAKLLTDLSAYSGLRSIKQLRKA